MRQFVPKNGDGERQLPAGVKCIGTLEGHNGYIGRLAWSKNGNLLATPSDDKTIRLWTWRDGQCVQVLVGHNGGVNCVSFSPDGELIASGSDDGTVRIWNSATFDHKVIANKSLEEVWSVDFSPSGNLLAAGSTSGRLLVLSIPSKEDSWENENEHWEDFYTHRYSRTRITSVLFSPTGDDITFGSENRFRTTSVDTSVKSLFEEYVGHSSEVFGCAYHPSQSTFATCGVDGAINLWDTTNLSLRLRLEGHTSPVNSVAFSPDGKILASKSENPDSQVKLWSSETGELLSSFSEPAGDRWPPSLAFHPYLPILAVVGSEPGTTIDRRDRVVHLYEIDITKLTQKNVSSVPYVSAKVVLVGDSGVGKTALGWRLAHNEFKLHSSTHGQQFWMLDSLCTRLKNGTTCETIIWDLAGQPDYRLTHALFLDDADIALILFDSTRTDPLAGVHYWLKQLRVGSSALAPSCVLVATKTERGQGRTPIEELEQFCELNSIDAFISTSAESGAGVTELIEQMRSMISWDAKATIVTTQTFKDIKDFVLRLKEDKEASDIILSPEYLLEKIHQPSSADPIDLAKLITAVRHLSNHGFVNVLTTSIGEERILLRPEFLNNLAASIVLEAGRNKNGLGALEETKLLAREYAFPELAALSQKDQEILIDSAVTLFLKHNICFRETDPLNGNAYLVFPELISMKVPDFESDSVTEDGVSYTVTGAVENVYASLVVLMGFTPSFTRINQWRNQARYEFNGRKICGFRQEENRPGELDFILYFGRDASEPIRTLFQGLFENFLTNRNLTVRRQTPVLCPNGHRLLRSVLRKHLAEGKDFAFCNECGAKISLPKGDEPLSLERRVEDEVFANAIHADQRSRFEQVLFQLKAYLAEQNKTVSCFISYAWGDVKQEQWVERQLATDLEKAGVSVLLDQWDNVRIASSVSRFVDNVLSSDFVVVVGTPLYQEKYLNKKPMGGYVVAAEGDLIGKRMLGSEDDKSSVMPVLLEGTEKVSFPPLLQNRVYADFREQEAYFVTTFDLLLSLFEIGPREPIAKELRDTLGVRSGMK